MGDDILVDTDFLAGSPALRLSVRLDVRAAKVLRALYLAEDAYYEYKYRYSPPRTKRAEKGKEG